MAEQFSIPPEKRLEAHKQLEDAAEIWQWHHTNSSRTTTPSTDRKSLIALAKDAERLRGSVQSLQLPARIHLEQSLTALELNSIFSTSTEPQAPSPVVRYPVQNNDCGILTFDSESIIELVAALEHAAVSAAKAIKPVPAGKRRDHALRMWMINISRLWSGLLGRTFSRDVTNRGEPITAAAQFCIAAFAYFDTDTPPSRILNEMKLCIKKMR